MRIAETLGISTESDEGISSIREPFAAADTTLMNRVAQDSSVEIDKLSLTDSSSFVSNESSFSMDSKDKSYSTESRTSFDSYTNDPIYQSYVSFGSFHLSL
jgi:hypothetical protein